MVRVMMLTGQTLEYVAGLDVLTFNALVHVLNRVHYREKLENAWISAASTSVGMTGKHTALERLEESWEEVIGKKHKQPAHYDPKRAKKGQSDFAKALGLTRGGKF